MFIFPRKLPAGGRNIIIYGFTYESAPNSTSNIIVLRCLPVGTLKHVTTLAKSVATVDYNS